MAINRYKFLQNILDKYPDQLENLSNGFYIDENSDKIHVSHTTQYLAKDKIKNPWKYE